MADTPDRRKRPRHQTPVEILRRLCDSLEGLRAEAEDDGLDVAAEALAQAIERIRADIKHRLV